MGGDMEQGNSSMRDRLLARLPQPENFAAYQDETNSLLAKHEKALFWEKWGNRVLSLCVVGVFMLSDPILGLKLDATRAFALRATAGLLFLWVSLSILKEFVYRSHVVLLKEVKQVQLQVLEVQASLRNSGTDKI